MTIILTTEDLSEYGSEHHENGGQVTYKDFRLESRAFFQASTVIFIDERGAEQILKARNPQCKSIPGT